jgi:hypothetical protein
MRDHINGTQQLILGFYERFGTKMSWKLTGDWSLMACVCSRTLNAIIRSFSAPASRIARISRSTESALFARIPRARKNSRTSTSAARPELKYWSVKSGSSSPRSKPRFENSLMNATIELSSDLLRLSLKSQPRGFPAIQRNETSNRCVGAVLRRLGFGGG